MNKTDWTHKITWIVHDCCSNWLSDVTPLFPEESSAWSCSFSCAQEESLLTCWPLRELLSSSSARWSLMRLCSAIWWFWRLLTSSQSVAWASAVELAAIESLSAKSCRRSFSMSVTSSNKACRGGQSDRSACSVLQAMMIHRVYLVDITCRAATLVPPSSLCSWQVDILPCRDVNVWRQCSNIWPKRSSLHRPSSRREHTPCGQFS